MAQAIPSMAMVDKTTPAKGTDDWRENLNLQLLCPECKESPPNLVEEFSSGDMVCGSCGLVLGGRIVDTRSEWRTFTNDDQGNDDPSRVGDGANPLLNGAQLETGISFIRNPRSQLLQKAQGKATQDKGNTALLAAYKEIGALCDAIGIPKNVSDTAKQLFKTVRDANAFAGKNREQIIAGCIFIACRQCKVHRTFSEIFDLTKVSKAEIGRIFKNLTHFFQKENAEKIRKAKQAGTSFEQKVDEYADTSATDPKDLCSRFCNQLDLNFQVTTVSQLIAEKMDEVAVLGGRSPLSVAATCIYIASHLMGFPKSPKEIAAVVRVSDGTIRNAYKIVYPKREMLIDPEWTTKGKGGIVGDLRNLPGA